MAHDRSVQDMIDLLAGDVSEETTTKTASEHVSEEALSAEILNRVRQDFTEEEIVKTAASAQMSGKIMADVIFQKFASDFAPFIAEVVSATLRHIVPPLVKQAIGTSTVIPTGTTVGEQKHDTKPIRESAAEENRLGTQISSITEKWLHTDKVEGAVVSGGGSPDSAAGNTPEGMMGPQKLSSAKFANLQKDIDAVKAQVFLQKVASIEEDLQRYQMLEQKQASGQPLSPQEQQEMEMLEAKLMSAMGQQGGAPDQAGAGAGGPPPGAGGPPPGAKAASQRAMTAEDYLRAAGVAID